MNHDRDLTPSQTHSLSPQQLEAITQESRLLFLEEEAPENLAILKQGIADLITKKKSVNSSEYTTLIRAAHTLKGGAGIAQLPLLCQLAHQLEDLLEKLLEQPENDLTLELIAENFQQIYELIHQATLINLTLSPLPTPPYPNAEVDHKEISPSVILSPPDNSKDLSTPAKGQFPFKKEVRAGSSRSRLPIDLLDKPASTIFIADFIGQNSSQQDFIKIALSVDLENCLQRLESLLLSSPHSHPQYRLNNEENFTSALENYPITEKLEKPLNVGEDSSMQLFPNIDLPAPDVGGPFYINLKESLTTFADEITLIGDIFHIFYLKKAANFIKEELKNNCFELEELARQSCHNIRQWKDQIIQIISQPNPQPNSPKENQDNLTEIPIEIEPKRASTSHHNPPNKEENNSTESSQGTIPEKFLKYIVAKPEKNAGTPLSLMLRVPVEQLDRLSDNVGELFINYEQISEYQQQLSQTSANLKKQIQKLKSLSSYRPKNNLVIKEVWQTEEEDLMTALNFNLPNSNEASIAPIFQRNYQEFYELAMQIYESSSDIDLLSRELYKSLDRLHDSLQNLNEDLTKSRLVTFGLLAERFRASLQNLNQQYDKTVELIVEGNNLLIDQALLQQLQTPLTHLFRNAFDHGIETTSQRLEAGKPKIARIFLGAEISGNYLTISLADDGRGIEIETIYKKAKEKGLIERDTPRKQLTNEEILEFIFTPGFSTATTKNDLSGRGVGLDIVRYQISRMRGTVQVETRSGYGTKFIINVPFKLRIVKLLLCRAASRTLAIPCLNVLGIKDLSEKQFMVSGDNKLGEINTGYIAWNNKNIPVFSLIDFLPYRCDGTTEPASGHPAVGLVLEVKGEPVVVAVDTILQERELVIKPFDETVPVPPYLAGCTVLGTGEIVPVISPDELSEKITLSQADTDTAHSFSYLESNSQPAALTEESNDLVSPLEPETQAETLPTARYANEEGGFYEEPLQVVYCPLPAAFFPPKLSILIADDSIAVRRALDQLLSGAGYQVTQRNDGKAAFDELQRNAEAFDLVISDLEMPGMNGFELLAKLRAHPNTRNLPVAILSSRDSEQCRQRAASLGVTAYFRKPWEPASLLDEIAALLS